MSKNNTIFVIFASVVLSCGLICGGCVSGKTVSYQKPFQNGQVISSQKVNSNNFVVAKQYSSNEVVKHVTPANKKGAELLVEKPTLVEKSSQKIEVSNGKGVVNDKNIEIIVETSPWIRLAIFYLSIFSGCSAVIIYLIYKKLAQLIKK